MQLGVVLHLLFLLLLKWQGSVSKLESVTEIERETRARQEEVKAVRIIEFKSNIVQQLHSPLRVIGPLILSINRPHLMVYSKSLQTTALTITIYRLGSNNISTRKLSGSMLCGLAMVEFIRSCTQEPKMISADSRAIEPWGSVRHHPLHSQESLLVFTA